MPTYQRVNEGKQEEGGSEHKAGGIFKSGWIRYALATLVLFTTGGVIFGVLSHSSTIHHSGNNESGEPVFDDLGRFVMKDFDQKKPMSNFLPGLAGVWGIPMWAFYVNRGQGITAFGAQNKDGAIAKFNTAEKAYQQTPFTGFRTFVKGVRGSKTFSHMPFFPWSGTGPKPKRDMIIGLSEMEIEEVADDIDLKTNVLYYTVPNEDFPVLIRKTTFTNLDKTSPLTIEALDGLGKIIPAGLSNGALDGIGRTMEAWMNVYNLGSGEIKQPFFHISQGTADTAAVTIVKDGYFAVAYEEGEDVGLPLSFIVDPSVVFDVDTSLVNPSGFFSASAPSLNDLLTQPQGTTSRTPCSFAGITRTIPAGASISIISVYGHASDLDNYLNVISPKILKGSFAAKKRQEAYKVADKITSQVETVTGSALLNKYIKQNYLDNCLRGGVPVILGDPAEPKIYHIFSRIHGDLERDYNYFQVDTTYFSQGPGNFRDVNQNRRLDVLITPEVGDFNIRMFLSFVQADGYNPLTVASTLFKVPTNAIESVVSNLKLSTSDAVKLTSILSKPYRPGTLFLDVAAVHITVPEDKEAFLNTIVAASIQVPVAQYAQNGYWADHWTYTLDLVDNYLSIYPDKEETLMYDSEPIPFYMSPSIVKSRADRYSLFAKDASKPDQLGLRSFSAVSSWGEKTFPDSRVSAMLQIFSSPDFVGLKDGPGGVWQRSKDEKTFTVSVISKLIILASLKFATLDPSGMGVEMEGGKPGWNDAMNGLPGLLGSGMPETYEMLRILNYVASALRKYGRSVYFPIEFDAFLGRISKALSTHVKKSENAELTFWNLANDAREIYRESVVAVFDGATVAWTSNDLLALITAMQAKTQTGIDKAVAMNGGISPSYFYYECNNYVVLNSNGFYPNTSTPIPVAPGQQKYGAGTFTTHSLPLFLEGPVRHLKVINDVQKKREVYQVTKSSALYDAPLKMFMLSASLADMGQDVGRMKAFSPGWLENQSIWLHMSYKFYLELIRGGLYSEFFEEIKTGLVPFMDNDVYGRSPLEAASFIVSSAFPDKKLHGASFLARLSGSTAEFLSMWALMMFGHAPFSLSNQGTLLLTLKPILPGWLFTEEGTASSTFLGAVKVTYHNPGKADTWTISPNSGSIVTSTGTTITSTNGIFEGEVAELVRAKGVTSIDIYF